MTFNALTSAVTVAGVARDAGVVGIDSRDLQRSEPEDLALLAVIGFLRMEQAMTRPTLSVRDSPAWTDSITSFQRTLDLTPSTASAT